MCWYSQSNFYGLTVPDQIHAHYNYGMNLLYRSIIYMQKGAFETELQFKPTPNFLGRTSVYYSSVTDKIDKASGLQPDKPLLGTDYYDNTKGTEVYGGEFLLRWRNTQYRLHNPHSSM